MEYPAQDRYPAGPWHRTCLGYSIGETMMQSTPTTHDATHDEANPERGWDFEAATIPYLDALYNMAYRLTHNAEDTEDLLQETYLKAYKYYDKFEEGTNLKAWLFRIMKNTFINGYRKKQQQPPESAFSEIEDSFESMVSEEAGHTIKTPEDEILENVLDEDVQKAIDSLPEDYRMVVMLVDLEASPTRRRRASWRSRSAR